MEIPNVYLKDLLESYLEAVKENSSVDYESAPSGEFAEYNQHKLQLEAVETAYMFAISSLGFTPEKLYRILYKKGITWD